MVKDIQYDPAVVGQLAKRLYRRAVFVLFFYPALGVLLLGLNGYTSGIKHGVVIGAVLGAFFGYLFATLRSMTLKMRAQNALCLARIEENTRAKQQPGDSMG
jgi:hypothetical protein